MEDNGKHTERARDAAQMSSSFGYRRVGAGEKQPLVDAVFHRVADRYDLMNDLMSAGVHRLWKQAMVAKLSLPRQGGRQWRGLDMAGGTGDIAFRIAQSAGAAAHVTVADINASMLEVGRERARKQEMEGSVEFIEANAEELPFAENCFDAYTIAFGIRNVPRIDIALKEALRVLKPGGQFVCLEFSQVDLPLLEKLYEQWSFNAIPQIGQWVTGDRGSYEYLVESIRKFPDRPRFAGMIANAGFARVGHEALSGGIVALHWGWKL